MQTPYPHLLSSRLGDVCGCTYDKDITISYSIFNIQFANKNGQTVLDAAFDSGLGFLPVLCLHQK